MEYIDSIKINFSPDQLILLNFCLGFLMFGVALDIRINDFRKLAADPRPPAIGLIAQLIWLPLLTLAIIFFLRLPPSMSLGLILVAACPGGNVSNYAVHLAKANTALSILMTSVSTLTAIVLTPLYFTFFAQYVPDAGTLQQNIYVDPLHMLETILMLIILPLSAGMGLNYIAPRLTAKIRRSIKVISMILFFGIVVYAIAGNFSNIQKYLKYIFFIVLAHNGLALLTGYQWARLMGLGRQERRAISIETGIQNSGLALIIIFNFFDGLGGMALVAAWWGIWHLIAGFGLAIWWSRSPVINDLKAIKT